MGEFNTLTELLCYVLNTYRNSKAFNYLEGKNWVSISTEQFIEMVRRVSLGIYSLGVQKGDCVGLLAPSSPHWLVADFAIQVTGALSVPLFTHISAENFAYQVEHSKMKALIVLGKESCSIYRRKFFNPGLITITSDQVSSDENVFSWNTVMEKGDLMSVQDPSLFVTLRNQVKPSDIATIMYTSGTTGFPKGVKLSQFNIISQVQAAPYRFPLDPKKDKALSILPLAHIFERMLMYYYMSSGINIYFADSIARAGVLFKEIKPSICAVVPRVLEKACAKIKYSINENRWFQKKVGRWALNLAGKENVSVLNKLQKPLAQKLVYSKIQEFFGGKLQALVCGGAPLDAELCRFYLDVGIPVYQGYGLTEASPVISTNYLKQNKPGTVGLPFPGVEVKISNETEILVRGPNVMKGYLGDVESDLFVDNEGWLHTGDKGSIDSEGYLIIHGRVRDIYKTSLGKYVSPIPIEQLLCRSPLIEEALVIGEGKQFVTCLLFPNQEALQELNQEKLEIREFIKTSGLKKEIASLLKEVNGKLNYWEHIKKYHIILETLSIDNGELTPTLKLKRSVVIEKYQAQIAQLYGE